MTIYLLYYDTDYGAREEWNTFYTPVEAFTTKAARMKRINFLKKTTKLEFHEVDVETDLDPTRPSGYEPDEDDDYED